MIVNCARMVKHDSLSIINRIIDIQHQPLDSSIQEGSTIIQARLPAAVRENEPALIHQRPDPGDGGNGV